MDGTCYHSSKTCDGRLDCRDGTDEGSCESSMSLFLDIKLYFNQTLMKCQQIFFNHLFFNIYSIANILIKFKQNYWSLNLLFRWRDRSLQFGTISNDAHKSVATIVWQFLALERYKYRVIQAFHWFFDFIDFIDFLI